MCSHIQVSRTLRNALYTYLHAKVRAGDIRQASQIFMGRNYHFTGSCISSHIVCAKGQIALKEIYYSSHIRYVFQKDTMIKI